MSQTRTEQANRVTWLGFLVNLILTGLKLTAGLLGGSAAMVADAFHSLSDFATDIAVLISFRFVEKPADEDHAYGHGKVETLAGALVGLALAGVGVGILWNGIHRVIHVVHGGGLETPGWIALTAAVVSIGAKEWLFRITLKIGREIESQAVVANAWHHRSDAFSSVGTLVGIGGAMLLGHKWVVLDPVAAIVVSGFILKTAWDISTGCFKDLMEASLDPQTCEEIGRIVEDTPGASHPHNIRTRRVGMTIAVDLHLRVDGNMSVTQAHHIASQVEDRLRERFGRQSFVNIHVEPLKQAPLVPGGGIGGTNWTLNVC